MCVCLWGGCAYVSVRAVEAPRPPPRPAALWREGPRPAAASAAVRGRALSEVLSRAVTGKLSEVLSLAGTGLLSEVWSRAGTAELSEVLICAALGRHHGVRSR